MFFQFAFLIESHEFHVEIDDLEEFFVSESEIAMIFWFYHRDMKFFLTSEGQVFYAESISADAIATRISTRHFQNFLK